MDVESALKYIDKQIFKDGQKYLRESVRFNIVQLQSCNGLTSCPFSKADCEFEFFKDEKGNSFISFAELFKRGMTFLDEIVNVGIGTLERPFKNAILCLGEFFKTKGKGILMLFSFLSRLTVLYYNNGFWAYVQLKC